MEDANKERLQEVFKLAVAKMMQDPQSFPFSYQVPKLVKDYRHWVKPQQEMWLNKVKSKIPKCYLSVASFLKDLYQIYYNAISYNTDGCGLEACLDLIFSAQNLVDICEDCLAKQLGTDALEAAQRKVRQLAIQYKGEAAVTDDSNEMQVDNAEVRGPVECYIPVNYMLILDEDFDCQDVGEDEEFSGRVLHHDTCLYDGCVLRMVSYPPRKERYLFGLEDVFRSEAFVVVQSMTWDEEGTLVVQVLRGPEASPWLSRVVVEEMPDVFSPVIYSGHLLLSDEGNKFASQRLRLDDINMEKLFKNIPTFKEGLAGFKAQVVVNGVPVERTCEVVLRKVFENNSMVGEWRPINRKSANKRFFLYGLHGVIPMRETTRVLEVLLLPSGGLVIWVKVMPEASDGTSEGAPIKAPEGPLPVGYLEIPEEVIESVPDLQVDCEGESSSSVHCALIVDDASPGPPQQLVATSMKDPATGKPVYLLGGLTAHSLYPYLYPRVTKCELAQDGTYHVWLNTNCPVVCAYKPPRSSDCGGTRVVVYPSSKKLKRSWSDVEGEGSDSPPKQPAVRKNPSARSADVTAVRPVETNKGRFSLPSKFLLDNLPSDTVYPYDIEGRVYLDGDRRPREVRLRVSCYKSKDCTSFRVSGLGPLTRPLPSANVVKWALCESGKRPLDIEGVICEICKEEHDEEHTLICDRCDCGFHTFCLDPPVEEVPHGDWYCPRCRGLPLPRPVEPPVNRSPTATGGGHILWIWIHSCKQPTPSPDKVTNLGVEGTQATSEEGAVAPQAPPPPPPPAPVPLLTVPRPPPLNLPPPRSSLPPPASGSMPPTTPPVGPGVTARSPSSSAPGLTLDPTFVTQHFAGRTFPVVGLSARVMVNGRGLMKEVPVRISQQGPGQYQLDGMQEVIKEYPGATLNKIGVLGGSKLMLYLRTISAGAQAPRPFGLAPLSHNEEMPNGGAAGEKSEDVDAPGPQDTEHRKGTAHPGEHKEVNIMEERVSTSTDGPMGSSHTLNNGVCLKSETDEFVAKRNGRRAPAEQADIALGGPSAGPKLPCAAPIAAKAPSRTGSDCKALGGSKWGECPDRLPWPRIQEANTIGEVAVSVMEVLLFLGASPEVRRAATLQVLQYCTREEQEEFICSTHVQLKHAVEYKSLSVLQEVLEEMTRGIYTKGHTGKWSNGV